jgi:serine/threonine protein kinase
MASETCGPGRPANKTAGKHAIPIDSGSGVDASDRSTCPQVIHRDLKLENILLTRARGGGSGGPGGQLVAKLADFGLVVVSPACCLFLMQAASLVACVVMGHSNCTCFPAPSHHAL